MSKLNLVPAIKELEKEITKRKSEFNKSIQPYIDSLAQLKKLNQTCEFCYGKGKILRIRACAEDDRPNPNDPYDYKTCPYCAGTGLVGDKYEGDDFP